MRKTISDVKKLLRDNPEYGAAFHDYFETRREELMAVPWVANDDALSRKCSLMAGFIQDELLNEFGLKDVSRNLGKG